MLILGLAVGLFINLERQDQGNVLSNDQWQDKSTKLYRPNNDYKYYKYAYV